MILLLGLLIQLKIFNSLTLYPTIGEKFIYPIKKLGIAQSTNYSINNGWNIIQPIIKESKQFNESIISVSIGTINGDSNSITNTIAILSNNSLYLYNIDKKSIKTVLTYNSSLQCLDSVITGLDDNVILNCLNNRVITLLQLVNNQLTPITLNKQFTIANITNDSSITFTSNGYVILYMFENTYQQYIFKQGSYVIEYQGLFNYQSIKARVSYFGQSNNLIKILVLTLTQSNLLINGVAVVQSVYGNFINMALLTINYYLEEYLILLLKQSQIEIYLSDPSSQLIYIRTIMLQKVYQDIEITQNYVYLINNQSIDVFTFQNYQIEFYSTIQSQYNQLYTIQLFNLLFVIFHNQLNIIKYQEAYITTQAANLTQTMQINGYDKQNLFQFTSIPINYNDTNIYLVQGNLQVQSEYSQGFVNVQNLSVGTNQTFALQNQINGTQQFNVLQKNVSIISQNNTLIDLYYSNFDEMWIQVLYNNNNYQFTISQLQYNTDTQKLQTIRETQIINNNYSNYSAVNLQIFTIQQEYFLLQIFTGFGIIFKLTINSIQLIHSITQRINDVLGIIDQIQIVQDKFYIYYSNFQQIYQYQYYQYTITGPILINITCQEPSIESNQISYPQQLFIGCQGNIYIIQQTYGILGYYIIKNIPLTYNSILAPIQNGLFLYEYNTTYSQLYFIHLLDDLVITQVNTYELSLDYNISYSYSNYFFYIQQISQTGEIYQSIYQGEYMQQSAQYQSFQGQSLNAGIFQKFEYDLVYRYGEQIYIDYIPHFTTLQVNPQFNYSLQLNITSQYKINNQYAISNNTVNTIFVFNELKINNTRQSLSSLMENLTYSNYSQPAYKFKGPDYLTGLIQNYNLTCVNCSNFSYISPLKYQYDILLSQAQQILNQGDYLYILVDYNEIILLNPQLQINLTIFSSEGLACDNLFIEENSQNLCWMCQNLGNKIIYLYQYDQVTTNTTFSILGYLQDAVLFQSHYMAPMLQIIFAPNIYFLYYFTITTQTNLKELITGVQLSIQNNSYTYPISYNSSIDIYYYGLLTYQSNNRLYFFISQLYVDNNITVLIQNKQFILSDPLFDFTSPQDQFCGAQIYESNLNTTIMEFILCSANPIVLQITMNQLQILNFQVLCSLNQLNYNNTKFQYNQISYDNNMITSIVYNIQSDQLNLNLYYINSSLCQNRAVLQPIQYMIIQNKTTSFTQVQFIGPNLIAILLEDYIQFYSVSYQILALYQPQQNVNQVTLVVKAFNPSSESITYIQLYKTEVVGRSWLFWFLVGLISLIIITIPVVIYFVRRHFKQQRYERELLELQNREPKIIQG